MKKLGLILALIFTFTFFVKADVAPDPDEMRMSADLIIESNEDLSDYRFFLDFFGAVHEVEIKSKAQTTIPPQGGGARYSSGNLLAIPKKNLKDYPDKLSSPYDEKGKVFATAISQKKIDGIVELGKHRFSDTIKISERKNWTYPTYRLEKDGNSLKLAKAADISLKINSEEEAQIKSSGFSLFTIIGGILIALAALILGVFLFRKVLKKG